MRLNRSPVEIAFRLKQEFHNLRLWAIRPVPELPTAGIAALPAPPDLRGTSFEAHILSLAEDVLAGRYPLLGRKFDLGSSPDWRRDFISGRSSPLKYFRLIPYLDFNAIGDHKVIWELNRHQWMVVLAMAAHFTSRGKYRDAVHRHLDHWIAQNPFQEGINWCSALEVAFRALSWIWIHHLIGLECRELTTLYQHGLHIERNLSFYFSPNTHLLGEALALYALGACFPDWPASKRWRELGGFVVREQLDRQIRPDGSHFEQSSYYHVYALDMFLLFRVLGGSLPDERIAAMADYLHVLLGPGRQIPLIGDDDGGRLFHPYGIGTRFGRATLATCAVLLDRESWPYTPEDLQEQASWWIGGGALQRAANPGSIPRSKFFRNSGLVSLVEGDLQILFDAGPLGAGSAGHSHSDSLSVLARRGVEEILVDSGTYTYVADPAGRERFRSTASHNTVRVDQLEQATPAGPFRWDNQPEVELLHADDTSAEAVCRTKAYVHRRRIQLQGDQLQVIDDVDRGGLIEQFWHIGSASDVTRVSAEDATIETAPRSTVYGHKFEAPVIRVTHSDAPVRCITVIDLGRRASNPLTHSHETGSA